MERDLSYVCTNDLRRTLSDLDTERAVCLGIFYNELLRLLSASFGTRGRMYMDPNAGRFGYSVTRTRYFSFCKRTRVKDIEIIRTRNPVLSLGIRGGDASSHTRQKSTAHVIYRNMHD